ncbi:hypothetical protein TSUD_60340 [Trifolium subterraneum]|uniref:Reverse transcriptase zinc-binding domain-containing protein n=1 Tax=Trifolium subterraneum TaxID=3900 RepID=A0A2Z6PA04_TRISU|nr:hypothetical protein TSUD_60340 [Trifolium subterraneum]
MIRIKHRCGFSYGIAVGCSGEGRERAGGVALFWNDQFNISILSFSLNHIHGRIEGENGGEPWFVTGVYGFPDERRKKDTWSLINIFADLATNLWLCVGDPNDTLSAAEKKGGISRTFDQLTVDRDITLACGQLDLGFIGYSFTWSNGREGVENVKCRLDRALTSQRFISEHSPIKVMHLPRYGSDHSAISITLNDVCSNISKKRVYLFRFEERWYKDNRCEQLVHTTWSNIRGNCSSKIDSMKSLDNEFVDHRTSEVRKEIVRTEMLLQDGYLWSKSPDDLRRYMELERTRADLLQKEETLWWQRNIATWLKDGDRNTKFFHGKANQRKKTNCIKKLKDDDEIWWSGQDNVEKVFLHYFADLFSSSNPVDVEKTCEAIKKRLSPDHVELCNQSFTAKEIKETVGQMHPLKAPGRLITDNALIAMECFHWLKKKVKGKRGTMALKLDMAKTYDGMEWAFIREAQSQGIHGIQVARNAPKITHLMFVDDSLLFARANQNEANTIIQVLNKYQLASGQLVSFEKSEVSFSLNVPDIEKNIICNKIEVKAMTSNSRYLGLPGKRLLIKVVVQAIPSYIMSCYTIPEGSCANIESMLSKFWWGSSEQKNKIHWMSWDRLARAKNKGGLSFRGFSNFNKALLGKQCWRLMLNENSPLSRVKIWKDPWLPELSSFKVWSPVCNLDEDVVVAELIDIDLKKWKRELVLSSFNEFEANQILNIPLSWRLPDDKKETLRDNPEPSTVGNTRFGSPFGKFKRLKESKNFLWRVVKHILPTRCRLEQKGVALDPICPLCYDGEETQEHLFMHCQVIRRFWFLSPLGLHVPADVNLFKWMEHWLSNSNFMATQLFSLSLWTIWKMRNDSVFNKKYPNCMIVVQNVSILAEEFNLACNLISNVVSEPIINSDVDVRWELPPIGFLKVNIDAGCFKNNYTCWGLLDRNHKGIVQFAATKRERITCSPLLVEALSLKWCLRWIKDQNLQNVEVEMDAENVVNCLLRRINIVEIELIVVDCLYILLSLLNVSVLVVKSCKNKAAHGLVGVAMNLGSLLWFGNVPEPVSSIVISDLIDGNE